MVILVAVVTFIFGFSQLLEGFLKFMSVYSKHIFGRLSVFFYNYNFVSKKGNGKAKYLPGPDFV